MKTEHFFRKKLFLNAIERGEKKVLLFYLIFWISLLTIDSSRNWKPRWNYVSRDCAFLKKLPKHKLLHTAKSFSNREKIINLTIKWTNYNGNYTVVRELLFIFFSFPLEIVCSFFDNFRVQDILQSDSNRFGLIFIELTNILFKFAFDLLIFD